MNTINIILEATRQNPFKRHQNVAQLSEFTRFSMEVDNLICADSIIAQQSLIQNIRSFIKDSQLKDVDIKSALRLESQLNGLGEFCISVKRDLLKHYFIIKVVH